MSPIVIAALVALNLFVIFLLLAAPVGVRTITRKTKIAASRSRLWQALWPLGADTGWSGQILSAERVDGSTGLVRISLSWEGRDGTPIERTQHMLEVIENSRFAMRVTDDSALHQDFWSDYREEVAIEDCDGGSLVTFTRTDRYRGLAFCCSASS